MVLLRLKAAWRAFKNPHQVIGGREFELKLLLYEIYTWTDHKHTAWAKRAKKALDA